MMKNISAVSGSYVALIIILVVLFACFAAGLVALLATAKKRKNTESAEAPVAEDKPEDQSEEVAEEPVAEEEVIEEEPVAEEETEEGSVEPVDEEIHAEEVTTEEESEEEVIDVVPTEVYVENPDTESPETEEAEGRDSEDETETAGVVMLGERRILVQYNRSFLSKLIQADDILQSRYGVLKNELLSYKKVKSRISWPNESFRCGRPTVAKFGIRGKTLSLYLAIDPRTLEGTKYKYEDVGEVRKYEAVPTRLRLKSDRSVRRAVELIGQMMTGLGIGKVEEQNVDYSLPYETTEALINRKLIKVIARNENGEELTDLTTEEIINAPAEKFRLRTGMEVRESVTVEEAKAVITDEVAATFVEKTEPVVTKKSAVTRTGKKGIVNVDTLSAHFNSGDVVDLDTLKAKGLIAKNMGYVKVLARGTLNKALTVKAQDFSIDAVKMIIMVGGEAIQET